MAPPARFDTILLQARRDRARLDGAALGAFSLTTLGIASVVGAGIFVTTGEAAGRYAGPAVVISFALAGIAAALTAVCYAELAAMIPVAGSTYSYAYAAFGAFPAWFIGWDLLLEYLFAAATVAVGWSGYAVSMLGALGVHVPSDLAKAPFGDDPGILNVPAVLIVAATTALLVVGTRESARATNSPVVLKLTVLVLVVAVGITHVTPDNWSPFVPANTGGFGDFGASGIIRGAGLVFFAYIGFDAVSTAAGESRDPQRTVPIGLLVEGEDAQEHAGDRVERHLGGHGRREPAGLQRHLAERHARVADDDERVEMPVGEQRPQPVVEPLDGRLRQRRAEPEEDPGGDPQQRRAEGRRAAARPRRAHRTPLPSRRWR